MHKEQQACIYDLGAADLKDVASRDGPRNSDFLRAWPILMERYFCTVYDYAGKADLGKGCWNLPRKLWVTKHF